MRKHLSTIILVLILILGVAILLYPTVSDYWNSFHQSRAIASYIDEIENIDPADYEAEWARARAYNDKLTTLPNRFMMSEADYAEYEGLLNLTGSGIMGYIEDGIAYLNDKRGEPGDYLVPGYPRTLLKEYVRYARDEALDVFENNYQAQILAMQNERGVNAYAAAVEAAEKTGP